MSSNNVWIGLLNNRLNVCLHDAAGCSTGLTIGCRPIV